ncbi:exonuclease domain-containing protein [Vibrio metschnikovii]|uniref:DNA polymerase III subunit epsilon n=2 Tax=Bacteria TaxID=2 RepID=A0A9X0UH43_VIBME|nr:exonuclease domain-containing protein [Vibrio metschnikovii]EKO3676155.1 DNA polymerase III subunit epsilon [Vibrio metschnikovii]MBC5850415.1 DNA polymerase III subunit epsilon [Vibrio metschnikovii]MDM7486296.1 exonuclease domain-containing protein [Vibrio metschnikovii]
MFQALKRHFESSSKRYQQQQYLAKNAEWSPGLAHYLNTPLPCIEAMIVQVDFVAFDFETSGVNARQDNILSLGWVDMTLDEIDLAASEELFVCHPQFITAQSAQINHITPKTLSAGLTLDDAMDRLFIRLAGKVALVHGSCIERAFVERYLQQRYGLEQFPCVWIDTLQIEKQMTYQGQTDIQRSFQLHDVRARYGLPQYSAHSAAMDALATAELFTAQVKSIFRGHMPRVEKLMM